MRIIEKKVYYCDHCKKYRLTKNSMQIHESKCLFNPERDCRAAYCPGSVVSTEHIDYLRENRSSSGNPDDDSFHVELDVIEAMRNEMLDGCPICALAALCQARVQFKKEGDTMYWSYDFKPIHAALYAEWCSENVGAYY